MELNDIQHNGRRLLIAFVDIAGEFDATALQNAQRGIVAQVLLVGEPDEVGGTVVGEVAVQVVTLRLHQHSRIRCRSAA